MHCAVIVAVESTFEGNDEVVPKFKAVVLMLHWATTVAVADIVVFAVLAPAGQAEPLLFRYWMNGLAVNDDE